MAQGITINAAAENMLDALQTALNLESATRLGRRAISQRGLDIDYHYAAIRAAIVVAHHAGIKDEWDR